MFLAFLRIQRARGGSFAGLIGQLKRKAVVSVNTWVKGLKAHRERTEVRKNTGVTQDLSEIEITMGLKYMFRNVSKF